MESSTTINPTTINPTTINPTTINPTTMTAPVNPTMMYSTTLSGSQTTTGMTQSSPLVDQMDEAWKIAVYALIGALGK